MRWSWYSAERAGDHAGTADPPAVLFFFCGHERFVRGKDQIHSVLAVTGIGGDSDRDREGMPVVRQLGKAILDFAPDPAGKEVVGFR